MIKSNKYEVEQIKTLIHDTKLIAQNKLDNLAIISRFFTEVYGEYAYIFPDYAEVYFLNALSDNLTKEEIDIIIYRFFGNMSIKELAFFKNVDNEKMEKEILRIESKCRSVYRCDNFIHGVLFSKETEGNFDFSLMTIQDVIEVEDEKEAERKQKFNIEFTVEDLDLSVRAYNCLKRAGFNDDIDFEGKTYEDFKKIRNMNTTSLNEIVDKLESYGIIVD